MQSYCLKCKKNTEIQEFQKQPTVKKNDAIKMRHMWQ